MNDFHVPVLLQEVLDFLKVEKGKKYIDATLGGGGHTLEILKRGGSVLGIDVDQDAIEFVKREYQISNIKYQIGKDLILAQGNFRDIKKIAEENGFSKVNGIIFDLGVSSHQIETEDRGFSFQKDAPLDMRMDKSLGVTAEDLINALSKNELYELFNRFGEEPRARAISNIIVESRRVDKISTTEELLEIILRAYGICDTDVPLAKKASVAKRAFQALRIVVNDELNNLKKALDDSPYLLEEKGRLAVISFHSLEDRIVKRKFLKLQEEGYGTILTKRPIVAGDAEVEVNRRARSAKLRIFEKL